MFSQIKIHAGLSCKKISKTANTSANYECMLLCRLTHLIYFNIILSHSPVKWDIDFPSSHNFIFKACILSRALNSLFTKDTHCVNVFILNLPNFLNGIIHHPFLELYIIIFRGIKLRIWRWSDNSIIEPGQTATDVQAGLALYWWQRLKSLLVSAGKGLKGQKRYMFYISVSILQTLVISFQN